MDETLLERLGGETGINKIVEEIYKRALEDPRIKNRYNQVNLEELKRKEAAFVLALIKKDSYDEASLIRAHTGLGITKYEFNLITSIYEDIAKDQGSSSHTASQLVELLSSVREKIEGL